VDGGLATGQQADELADIDADFRVSGQQADIFIHARGDGVVVPTADMTVAADLVALPAQDERDFGMSL
jgi:hypothetical protein